MNPKELEKLITDIGMDLGTLREEIDTGAALIRLQEIAEAYQGADKVISSHEILEEMQTRPPQRKITTGITGLDNILDGFREKQLVVLSAATKSGKTTFAIELTSRLKAENPMWFPFEESAEEIIQKFVDRGEDTPLFYTPQQITGNTLLWIEKKIIEAKAKYDSKIVFIDHLHFIVSPGSEDINQRIGETMRQLKKLAVKWNMVVVLIAHLRKTQLDVQPTLEDLRDSSFIAQEADTVILLWRKTERVNGEIVISDTVNLSVQANRRTGKTGNVKLLYENGKFLEQLPSAAEREYEAMGSTKKVSWK